MTRRLNRIGQSLPSLFTFLALLSSLFLGCASDSHDQIATEFLEVMNRVVSVCDQIEVGASSDPEDPSGKEDAKQLETAAVTESAKKIKPQLAALLSELKSLESRLNSIDDVDDETKTKLSRRFESEFESLRPKFSRAMQKLEHPAAKKVLETEIKTLSSMFHAKPPR